MLLLIRLGVLEQLEDFGHPFGGTMRLIYTPEPSASGAALASFILNILEGRRELSMGVVID